MLRVVLQMMMPMMMIVGSIIVTITTISMSMSINISIFGGGDDMIHYMFVNSFTATTTPSSSSSLSNTATMTTISNVQTARNRNRQRRRYMTTRPITTITTSRSTIAKSSEITTTTTSTTTTTVADDGCTVVQYKEHGNIWMFRETFPISYDRYITVMEPPEDDDDARTFTTKVLLLNGFGMGTFHQHRLMNELLLQLQKNPTNGTTATSGTTSCGGGSRMSANVEVYAMDYIGQGNSWPNISSSSSSSSSSIDCGTDQNGTPSNNINNNNNNLGLQYSAQTWMEQIIQFMEQVVMVDDESVDGFESNNITTTASMMGYSYNRTSSSSSSSTTTSNTTPTKIHVVGNSLGGYLATYVASTRPDLIASLILLNATPIWGLNLPGWTGHLPVPLVPSIIGQYLFDIMRSKNVIQQFVNMTYVNDPTIYHPQFLPLIRSCTENIGGPAAFASILWSPPLSITTDASRRSSSSTTTTTNFYDCIQQVQCPVLLCYGQNDPWCKPAFAKAMLQRLQQSSSSSIPMVHKYVELSNVGHCPNHEAPIATAMIFQKWFQFIRRETNNYNRQQQQQPEPISLLDDTQSMVVQEAWGTTIVQERTADEIALNGMDRIAVAML